MDSALTPREIQSRIRSGEALAEVAKAAGVPIEQIEPFALPVLAERDHVTGIALAAQVRRGNEAIGGRGLRTVIHERLLEQEIDLDTVEWDSWRVMDRKWIVQATFPHKGEAHKAQFLYDQRGRFSVAHNDQARSLVQDKAQQRELVSNRRNRSTDPDTEPTVDYSDEFAIVRAIGAEPSIEQQLLSDDFALSEVDGMLDLAPPSACEMNNLYDMFTAMQEDSVQIYPGLADIRPISSAPPTPPVATPHSAQPQDQPTPHVQHEQPLSRRERRRLQAEQNSHPQSGVAVPPPQPVRPEPVQRSLTSAVEEPQETPHAWRHVTRDALAAPVPLSSLESAPAPSSATKLPLSAISPAAPATSSTPSIESLPHQPVPVEKSTTEPEQNPVIAPVVGCTMPTSTETEAAVVLQEVAKTPMLTEDEPTVAIPKATSKKKRASVPSWDEIMFGAPRPKK